MALTPSNPYLKPVQPVSGLIQVLKIKGLIINNQAWAEQFLSSFSYYRFKGYALTFRNQASPLKPFSPGTTFEDIVTLIEFDKSLRILTFDGIEKIEVFFRTRFNEYMCNEYNTPFWYQNEHLFKKKGKFRHKEFLSKCERELHRSNELFARHYKNNYDSPCLPPGWLLAEIHTFGTWSTLYEHLADSNDKIEIAKTFGVTTKVMESWARSLCNIRNICAHHSRLWNKELRVPPAIPNALTYPFLHNPGKRFSSIALIIHQILNIISPNNTWSQALYHLLLPMQHRQHSLGFKSDWCLHSFWGITIDNDFKFP